MSTSLKMRISFVLFVAIISLGVLALSPNAHGAEKKTLQVLSERYKSFNSSYEGIDPQFLGFME